MQKRTALAKIRVLRPLRLLICLFTLHAPGLLPPALAARALAGRRTPTYTLSPLAPPERASS